MNYRVKGIGKTCAATGRPLAPGSMCHSVLVERDGETRRLDYSPEGWTHPPEGTIGYWRCTVPESNARAKQPLDTATLFRFFESLGEECNEAHEHYRYVSALVLLQKRRLRLEGSQDAGGVTYLELVGSTGEGPYLLRDWQLSAEEIRAREAELQALLEPDDDDD
jgi:hypothetical protein